MKILFDHQAFSNQNYGGVSRYITELIYGINESNSNKAYLSLLLSNNLYLKEFNLGKIQFFPKKNFYKKESIIYRINEQYCRLDLMKKKFDIFHATYYDPYFINFIKTKPFVVTFHDMIHEIFADEYKDFSKNRWHTMQKKIIAEYATYIIAVSNSTKNDLVNIFNINPNKIHVVYHGNSLKESSKSEIQLTKTHILYVGNRQRYKNFQALLYAIAPTLRQNKLTLVCAGGGAFDVEEFSVIKSLGLLPFVKQQFIHNDWELSALYRSAITFIFPTKYEGFGIPVLEAFSCGCPCLLSNTSSLPEIGGDAALYFNPNDQNSIKIAFDKMLSDENLRNSLVEKGYYQLEKFSWRNTVHNTLAVYEKCF